MTDGPTQQAVTQAAAETKPKPAVPRLKVIKGKGGGPAQLDLDHPDKLVAARLLSDAVGTKSHDFLTGILGQLANIGLQKAPDELELNFALSMVTGIEPRDQLEAMLAAQMTAVHNATMTFARRLNHIENLQQQDSAERAFTSVARTFAARLEALKRYRSGGEQTVRVEHVTINGGGQAFVGNISAGGVLAAKSLRQPHERGISVPKKPSLYGHIEANPAAMPSTGGHWLDRLPIRCCARRRAEREAQRHVSAWHAHEGSGGLASSDLGSAARVASTASTLGYKSPGKLIGCNAGLPD